VTTGAVTALELELDAHGHPMHRDLFAKFSTSRNVEMLPPCPEHPATFSAIARKTT
jgi:hypothetical protein